jgi:uncharacterized repeat protein (TIGR03803 family)
VLYSFCSLKNCADGAFPLAGVIFDAVGNLYGTTSDGGVVGCGPYRCGTVFKLTPNSDGSWTESVLHSFTGGADGARPLAGLILDQAGNFYGTTQFGGNRGSGVVFKLAPNSNGGWNETVLHYVQSLAAPSAVIFDAAGSLYGTTENGGPANGGAVFKLAHNSNGSWAFSVLRFFFGKPALNPAAGVVLDKAGNLYGTTFLCGTGYNCQGVVFEITP